MKHAIRFTSLITFIFLILTVFLHGSLIQKRRKVLTKSRTKIIHTAALDLCGVNNEDIQMANFLPAVFNFGVHSNQIRIQEFRRFIAGFPANFGTQDCKDQILHSAEIQNLERLREIAVGPIQVARIETAFRRKHLIFAGTVIDNNFLCRNLVEEYRTQNLPQPTDYQIFFIEADNNHLNLYDSLTTFLSGDRECKEQNDLNDFFNNGLNFIGLKNFATWPIPITRTVRECNFTVNPFLAGVDNPQTIANCAAQLVGLNCVVRNNNCTFGVGRLPDNVMTLKTLKSCN